MAVRSLILAILVVFVSSIAQVQGEWKDGYVFLKMFDGQARCSLLSWPHRAVAVAGAWQF